MKKTKRIWAVLFLMILVHGCSRPPEYWFAQEIDSPTPAFPGVVRAPVDGGRVVGSSAVPMVQQGFAVSDFQARRDEYGRIFVIGEVKNVGKATQGVELEATLRDAGNRVVAFGHFCPAANHSIAPNDTLPFAHSFGRGDEGVQAEVRIVRTFYTMDTLGTAAIRR